MPNKIPEDAQVIIVDDSPFSKKMGIEFSFRSSQISLDILYSLVVKDVESFQKAIVKLVILAGIKNIVILVDYEFGIKQEGYSGDEFVSSLKEKAGNDASKILFFSNSGSKSVEETEGDYYSADWSEKKPMNEKIKKHLGL